MKKIALTQGQYALVDDADYAWLNQWKWYAWWSEHTQTFYASRGITIKGRGHRGCVYMHRAILGLTRGDGKQADHIDPSRTLDNRRKNLRIATRLQNQANQRIRKNNRSGFKGVSWDTARQRWQAHISYNSKCIALGYFDTPQEGHKAYCAAAEKYHGEFARTA